MNAVMNAVRLSFRDVVIQKRANIFSALKAACRIQYNQKRSIKRERLRYYLLELPSEV